MGLDQPHFFWESHSFEAIFDEIVDNPFDTVVAFAFFTTLLTVESVGCHVDAAVTDRADGRIVRAQEIDPKIQLKRNLERLMMHSKVQCGSGI